VAVALGMSPESFDRYVRPHVKVMRLGDLKLYPVADLERWTEENSALTLVEAER
jgi:hypothetical protein